jgi:hypothetical protein
MFYIIINSFGVLGLWHGIDLALIGDYPWPYNYFQTLVGIIAEQLVIYAV